MRVAFLCCNRRVSQRALQYIKKSQRPDGSWFGSWAICFTYAAMFSLGSLSSIGETYENRYVELEMDAPILAISLTNWDDPCSDHSRRGCDFLLSKQMADGGWGETYKVRRHCP